MNKASSHLNLNIINSSELMRCKESERERDVWIIVVISKNAFPCQGTNPAGDVLRSVNTIDTVGKLAHKSLICFSVSTWMKLNYAVSLKSFISSFYCRFLSSCKPK